MVDPERLSVASDTFHAATFGAPNLWAVLLPGVVNDSTPVGGIPARELGHLLFALALLAVAGIAVAARDRLTVPQTLSWAAAASAYSFYVFETRCHERYLFPAVVLLLVWLATHGCRGPALWATLLTVAVFSVTIAAVLLDAHPWQSGWYVALAVAQLAAYALTVGTAAARVRGPAIRRWRGARGT